MFFIMGVSVGMRGGGGGLGWVWVWVCLGVYGCVGLPVTAGLGMDMDACIGYMRGVGRKLRQRWAR